ncbi:hypothetical protein [Paenibacillus silvae]|uniref:hypothetical protein n=1 Tax=Paenibacillus silvae TaxID=1325358 RepID=UPI002006A467|nr:hypothetical protein [Paenibacillus silvae]MCK6075250.1 hypothetical protein [Paenibacillus silvae]MCK6149637.1 hypothetical protein [Paenibacillus silvae]MCK6267935.1 hypothetical protein [Paenibacillus silvae]
MDSVIAWFKKNHKIEYDDELKEDVIWWTPTSPYSQIVTPVPVFLMFHGAVVADAISNNQDVKAAVAGNDPENVYGFNELI